LEIVILPLVRAYNRTSARAQGCAGRARPL